METGNVLPHNSIARDGTALSFAIEMCIVRRTATMVVRRAGGKTCLFLHFAHLPLLPLGLALG